MENNEEKKQIQLNENDLIINRRLSKLFSLINKYEELSKKGTWLYKPHGNHSYSIFAFRCSFDSYGDNNLRIVYYKCYSKCNQ